MGFLLLFHSVKRYKKGISDKFVDVLSRLIVCITTFLKHHFVLHESYAQKNTQFQDVYSCLSQRNQVEDLFTICIIIYCIILVRRLLLLIVTCTRPNSSLNDSKSYIKQCKNNLKRTKASTQKGMTRIMEITSSNVVINGLRLER